MARGWRAFGRPFLRLSAGGCEVVDGYGAWVGSEGQNCGSGVFGGLIRWRGKTIGRKD